MTENFTRTVNTTVSAIIKIINNTNEKLKVTLKNTSVDAEDKDKTAMTVEGSADLTLKGSNTLTGGIDYSGGKAGLSQTGNGSLTISGSGSLTATGGSDSAKVLLTHNGKTATLTVDGVKR